MTVQVLMPQLGESVVEGTITKWLKSPGDTVQEYEPLLEINTDKVDSEIPSPASGTLLEILVPEGTVAQAGTLLARIGTPEEAQGSPGGPGEAQAQPALAPTGQAVAPAAERVASPAATISSSSSPESGRELGFISPVVAKIARENSVDLSQIQGTGQNGRITKKDVLAYLENRPAAQPSMGRAEPAPAPNMPAPAALSAAPVSAPAKAPKPSQAPAAPLPGSNGDEILPLGPVRRAIAEHMVFSKHTSPHVSTVMEVDLSRVVAHREANKDAFGRDGVNLTFSAYFVAASIAALKAFPVVNSSWSDAGIVVHHAIHIGLATSLGEQGLIVPVIKNADSLSLLGLARTVNDLSSRARARKLQPDEVKEGTFTITNHGVSGSLFAMPVINQPQCAILGVGMIQKRVVVVNSPELGDTIAIRPMAYLSLTFDHRILDGATGDAFLGKVVETLRDWG